MENLFSVEGKVVVITGGGGILGRGMAEHMCSQGAKVVILDRSEEAGNKLVNELIAKGYEASYFYCDVLNNEVLEQNSQDIVAKYGRIDVLVNAAGGNMPGATIGPDSTIFDLQMDAFRKVVDLNLFGTVSSTFLPSLRFVRLPAWLVTELRKLLLPISLNTWLPSWLSSLVKGCVSTLWLRDFSSPSKTAP